MIEGLLQVSSDEVSSSGAATDTTIDWESEVECLEEVSSGCLVKV